MERLARLEDQGIKATEHPSALTFFTLPGCTLSDDDLAEAVGANRPVRIHQVHGCRVQSTEEPLEQGDGLISNNAGDALIGLSADCPIVLAYDTESPAIGMAHSGWRGTALNIAGILVKRMGTAFDVPPKRLRIWIGPSIGGCCYEVGDEVFEALNASLELLEPVATVGRIPNVDPWRQIGSGERDHLDLAGMIGYQLVCAGIRNEDVTRHSACTHCDALNLHSYRRDGEESGRTRVGIVKTT